MIISCVYTSLWGRRMDIMIKSYSLFGTDTLEWRKGNVFLSLFLFFSSSSFTSQLDLLRYHSVLLSVSG